jgi:hypothetical protein
MLQPHKVSKYIMRKKYNLYKLSWNLITLTWILKNRNHIYLKSNPILVYDMSIYVKHVTNKYNFIVCHFYIKIIVDSH